MLLLALLHVPSSLAATARWDYEDAYDNVNGGDWYRDYDNESANLAWGESYVMISLASMFRATGDPEYLDRLAWHVDGVLAQRDDARGVTDYRGVSGACWRNTSYQSGGQAYCYAVHSGMITQPMVEFARLVRDSGLGDEVTYDGLTLAEKADAYTTAAEETVAFHDREWNTRGYYVFPSDATFLSSPGHEVPLNQENALGATLIILADLTGDSTYADKAADLAQNFADQISLGTDGSALWNYSGGTYSAYGEDISHAAINVDFAIEAEASGIVFDQSDLDAFAATFVNRVYVDDATFSDHVGGGATNGSSYLAQTGRWLRLTPTRTTVYTAVRQLYDANWPAASIGSASLLVAQAYLAEFEPPLCPHTFYTSSGRVVDWSAPDASNFREATAYGANILTLPPDFDSACMIPLTAKIPRDVTVQQWDGAAYHDVAYWQSTSRASADRWVPYEPQWPYVYSAGSVLFQFKDTFVSGDGIQVQQADTYTSPTLLSTPTLIATVGQDWTYSPTADGDSPFWWSLTDFPLGVRTNAATGAILWTPTAAGAYAFTLEVDNDSGSDQQSFVVTVSADDDGDGFGADDCDDTNAGVHPGGSEICDPTNVDEDCDGLADDDDPSATGQSTFYADLDGDGHGDASSTRIACDAPASFVADATDCDDSRSTVHPGAAEVCDAGNVDEDCDGLSNDADPSVTGQSTFYADLDGDGYGDAASSVMACTAPAEFVTDATDCDDSQSAVNPGAQEVCDAGNVDENCDGLANDADPSVTGQSTFYADLDGDGYGDADRIAAACAAPAEFVTDATDCDDSQSAVNPGADEVCDAGNVDENCDGLANDADPSVTGQSTFYADLDGDGYGDPDRIAAACAAPAEFVTDATDCDDSQSAVNPGADEVCDAGNVDEDCDGLSNDADPSVTGQSTFYADLDGDGYGEVASSVMACSAPAEFVTDATDCDDSQSAVNPGADEVCDAGNVDENCDGLSNDADPSVTGQTAFYVDADGDGYGAGSAVQRCEGTSRYVPDDTDCDDSDASTFPGATDIVGDGVDEDCDGAEVCYVDHDDDGYRSSDTVSGAAGCDGAGEALASAPDGDCDDTRRDVHPGAEESDCMDPTDYNCDGSTQYADQDTDGYAACEDCDDGNGEANPGAVEVCNGVDDDCDGAVDVNATDAAVWYADADSDGFVDPLVWVLACDPPPGYAAGTLADCDDADPEANPDAVEVPGDGVDQDCDGYDGVGAPDSGVGNAEDPAAEKAGCGCANAPTGSAPGGMATVSALVGIAGLARRRRRRA